MPRGLAYQDGANQRNIKFLYYQDGGSLRTITEAYYQDGANLRQWWPPEYVLLNNVNANAVRVLPDANPALARIGAYADGFVKRTINAGGALNQYQWLLTGVVADYDVRLTTVSGTAPAGPALATWHNMAADQIWSLQKPGGSVGVLDYVGTVEMALAGTGVPILSATFDFHAEVTI